MASTNDKNKNENENEINLKILILGDSSVGKTSLLLRYVDGYLPVVYVATIGVEYKIKTINVNGHDINLQIWDTAGQERFRSITQSFMKGADGILYVYDITKKNTFDNLKTWIFQTEQSTDEFKKIIVGNKIDLENLRQVSKEACKKFCEEKNIQGIEVSAKNGNNVSEPFEILAKMIIGKKSKDELLQTYTVSAKGRGLSITKKKKEKKEKKKCC